MEFALLAVWKMEMRPCVSALLLGAKKSGAEEKSLTDGADGMAHGGGGGGGGGGREGVSVSPSTILGEAGIELGVA